MLPSVDKNSEGKSNPICSRFICIYLHLHFLVSFTDSNKQLFHVKSVFKFVNWF